MGNYLFCKSLPAFSQFPLAKKKKCKENNTYQHIQKQQQENLDLGTKSVRNLTPAWTGIFEYWT